MWCGTTGHGDPRQGEARRDETRRGEARRGVARGGEESREAIVAREDEIERYLERRNSFVPPVARARLRAIETTEHLCFAFESFYNTCDFVNGPRRDLRSSNESFGPFFLLLLQLRATCGEKARTAQTTGTNRRSRRRLPRNYPLSRRDTPRRRYFINR